MVTIAEFTSYIEAMVAKASLEANGVRCFIPNENMIRIEGGSGSPFPGLGFLQGGIQLQVAERDAEQARKFIEQTR